MKRRESLAAIAALAVMAIAPASYAQDYPNKLIRIISPYGPGGGNDTIAPVGHAPRRGSKSARDRGQQAGWQHHHRQ